MKKSNASFETLLMLGIPCLCFALLSFLTLHYVIAVPRIDQWEMVSLLEKSYQGQLTLGDLWAQHNEHRMLFPRLIMLGLAHFSHWDLRWELITNLLLAVGILCVIGIQLRQTARIVGDRTLLGLFPIVSIAVFSLRQSENWMWGWQIQIFLNILAVVAGNALLTHPTPTWGKLIAAMLCGVIATYSFANGLLFWLAGGFALRMTSYDRNGKARMAVWGVCAGLTIGFYLYHYTKPSGSPPLLDTLAHPAAFVAYFLTYMGAFISIKDTPLIGVPMGILGLALFVLSWRKLRQSGQLASAALAPYLAYALYVVLSALVSAVGRADLGVRQAMSSRYLTISELFWIATLALCFLAVRQRESARGAGQWPHRSKQVMVIAGLLLAINSLKNIRAFSQQYAIVHPVEQQMLLLHYEAGAGLSFIPNEVKECAPLLRERHLALYRQP